MVWVGTGENNSQRSVAYGDGVYRSLDGGQHWTEVRPCLTHTSHRCAPDTLERPNGFSIQTKERMMLEIERDPVFNNEDRHDLTRPEVRERTMRKVCDPPSLAEPCHAMPCPPPCRTVPGKPAR